MKNSVTQIVRIYTVQTKNVHIFLILNISAKKTSCSKKNEKSLVTQNGHICSAKNIYIVVFVNLK